MNKRNYVPAKPTPWPWQYPRLLGVMLFVIALAALVLWLAIR